MITRDAPNNPPQAPKQQKQQKPNKGTPHKHQTMTKQTPNKQQTKAIRDNICKTACSWHTGAPAQPEAGTMRTKQATAKQCTKRKQQPNKSNQINDQACCAATIIWNAGSSI